jgi:hypothetical protein
MRQPRRAAGAQVETAAPRRRGSLRGPPQCAAHYRVGDLEQRGRRGLRRAGGTPSGCPAPWLHGREVVSGGLTSVERSRNVSWPRRFGAESQGVGFEMRFVRPHTRPHTKRLERRCAVDCVLSPRLETRSPHEDSGGLRGEDPASPPQGGLDAREPGARVAALAGGRNRRPPTLHGGARCPTGVASRRARDRRLSSSCSTRATPFMTAGTPSSCVHLL